MAIATPAEKREKVESHGEKQKDLENKQKLEIKRVFTYPNKDPYESVEWGIRDAVAGDFEQKGVEAPVCWSDSAVGICSKLYFATCEDKRESSIKTLIRRVVQKIANEGIKYGYFDEDDSFVFEAELAYILINQFAAFNSPVWFNFGVPGRKQCGSACFNLNVEDHMFGEDSISEWITNEAKIFKSGSGSGANLSKLRGSMEPLSTGGVSSGPISFMRVADANCGSVKAGNTRRGAKIVHLNVDHPDILDFIDCKVREDRRMRALMDAGFNLDPSTPEGEKNIAECTSFQNANISVRLSDEYMKAVEDDEDWTMWTRVHHEEANGIKARELLTKIAEATWQCADPGVMFDDTINAWHTTPSLGRINVSNPCGELCTNDNSSCNLASLNLVKFLDDKKGFLFKRFNQVVDIMITAMDITCSFSELPTKKLEENTRNLRQLGLGYSNLGAALMIQGMPYNSDEGRDWAASVTSLMTGKSYRRSAEMASILGPFLHWKDNEKVMGHVIQKHIRNLKSTYFNKWKYSRTVWEKALDQWDSFDKNDGFRNSQVTVIAPTGSISFMMDCDTTGAEPLYSPVTYKKLASGGTIEQNVNCYKIAELEGYNDKVLQTSAGNNSISSDGHIKMLAAIQPHISGAISKTVNLPETATVQDIHDTYIKAWKMGIKCLAIYRDGSKATQVLSTKSESKTENSPAEKISDFVAQNDGFEAMGVAEDKAFKGVENIAEYKDLIPWVDKNVEFQKFEFETSRRRMNSERKSITHKFKIGEHEGYITAGMFDDGTLGEIFLSGIGKEGSTLRGIMDAFAISISLGLQHGVHLETLAEKFSHMDFEPKGLTNNPEIRTAHSMPDYIMRWLVSKFGDKDLCDELGIRKKTGVEKYSELLGYTRNGKQTVWSKFKDSVNNTNGKAKIEYGKICKCGAQMMRTGTCYSCSSCGVTTGCM